MLFWAAAPSNTGKTWDRGVSPAGELQELLFWDTALAGEHESLDWVQIRLSMAVKPIWPACELG